MMHNIRAIQFDLWRSNLLKLAIFAWLPNYKNGFFFASTSAFVTVDEWFGWPTNRKLSIRALLAGISLLRNNQFSEFQNAAALFIENQITVCVGVQSHPV